MILTIFICIKSMYHHEQIYIFFIHIYIDNINLDADDIVVTETEPSTDNETHSPGCIKITIR